MKHHTSYDGIMQQPDLANIRIIKKLLASCGIRPNKTFGQNFLVSKRVLAKIIETAELTKDDTVLEVGPGLGTLTVELSKHCKRVIAVEKDRALLPILKETLAQYPNVEIVHGDILTFNPKSYQLKPISYKLVADLPYYLTSRLLRLFLETPHQPSHMVLLVQKEVAKRICATPPHASILSNAVQYYAMPKNILAVPKNSFYPAPSVDSMVLKLSVTRAFSEKTDKNFMDIMKKSFSSPRKQLAHTLSGFYEKERVNMWLAEARIRESQRPQEIALEQWITLAGIIQQEAA